MKVGIIGGGIGGLTCAYRLSQKGINPIIFEKEPLMGGRIPYSGAIASEKFQKRAVSLIKELDLEELKVPLEQNDIAFLSEEGKIVELEEFQKRIQKTFSRDELAYLEKLNNFVNNLDFDIGNPSPEILKLREISFSEYLKDCPQKVMENVIRPETSFSFEQDFEKMSGDYGLSVLRHSNELVSGGSFTFEGANMITVVNLLYKKLEEKGVPILTGAEVRKVQKSGEKFLVSFRGKGEKIEVEEVDKIVFALPLFLIKGIFPELEIETNIVYKDSKCLFVRGRLKYEKKFILGMPQNSFNLRGLFNIMLYEQLVFPIDEKKEVDLSPLYESYKIVGEKKLGPALPVVPPAPQIPGLKTKIEGVYLCGDFYFYPWSETSISTAEVVADLIKPQPQS